LGGGGIVLWFFPKEYFVAELKKIYIFASKMQGKNILLHDFHP
jgi:hypothetical protein